MSIVKPTRLAKAASYYNVSREEIVNSMVLLWTIYWPTQRFQTQEEIDKWIKANEN